MPEEETACTFKVLQSMMDPNSIVDSLRASLESYKPFSVTDPEPPNSLGQPDMAWTDTLVDPLNSIVKSEFSELRDCDGEDHNKIIDACERKNTEVASSSTRRSTRKSRLNQKNDTELVARKLRKRCAKKPMVDLLLVNIGRRRRSDLVKRGRIPSWGLLGSTTEVFEQNAEKNVTKSEHISSKKGKNSQKSGKRNNDVVSESIRNSGGESQALKKGIRVKFKFGNKAIQSCQFNVAPAVSKDLESNKEVKEESSKLLCDVKDEYEEHVPRGSMCPSFNEDLDKVVMQSEASVVDVLLADKDKSEYSAGKGGNNIHKIVGVGETVENSCLDPGTSPDSEVIDVIPDTHVSGVAEEGLHVVQIPSKASVSHKEIDGGVASGLPSPDIIDDVLSSDKCRGDEKIRNDSCAGVTSLSRTTIVTSSNPSSRAGCPMEPMASLQETEVGVPLEMLEIASEGQPELSHGIGPESVDSQGPEKLLSDAKANGQKIEKSSRSRGTNKSKSEVLDPVNKKRFNSRHKGLNAKSNGKGRNKEKNGNYRASWEVDTETGNCESDDIVQLTEDCKLSAGDSSNSTMAPTEGENPHGQPRNAWVCCDDCHKWRRIPAILADSIESTECRWICKDNMDKDFADCSIAQEKSNAAINEELEISDASCEEDACETQLNANRLGQKQPKDPLQSSWKLIRTNLFLHRNRKNQTVDEIMVCHCKPPTDGRRGCRDGCLNRMLNIECVKGTCPCGELCSNQQFQKRNYAKLKCFRCGKKGYGLQLLEDIPKGRFLIEYVGEVLDMPAYEARQRDYAKKGHKHFYFMTLNGSEVIDACAKGNLGRFINHSCEPNCRTEKWMVNGEVCIGLFAIRDIKKGEELTFDYNYVRVFGAAAKKCVCGSSRCRGFIGGDPLNAETVVLGDSDDEYPEPVMLYESGDKLENMFSGIGSFDSAGIQTAEITSNGGEGDKVANAAGYLENAEKEESLDSLLEIDDKIDTSTTASDRLEVGPENDVFSERSSYAASVSKCQVEDADGLLPYSVQHLSTPLQANEGRSETTSTDSPDHSAAEEDAKGLLSTGEKTKTSLVSSVSNLLTHTFDTKRKTKSHSDGSKCCVLKPHSRTKISRPSSSMKRGKPINNVVSTAKPPKVENRSPVVPQKAKRLTEDASNGRFEAVQETLNALLNPDGGISKRRDASKGYLKLLFLTAASGDSGNGEGIQSNRDLSMILDALLKTKSRTVLLDVINKNGLQMLHNIMKRYRREFNKIPILRKLLKVLEYLAEVGILTLESILKDPSCPGAESFRQSMLLLTEHADKQVHQIARNFRDRWIPRTYRRINLVEKDVEMMEFQRGSNFSKSRTSANPSDQDRRVSDVADNCIKQSFSTQMPPVDGRSLEGSSASCVSTCITTGTRTRKRKSRWDMPGDVNPDMESPSNKESRLKTGSNEEMNELSHAMDEDRLSPDEDGDAPPGFSSPINHQVLQSNAPSASTDSDPVKVVIGYPQERFTSQLSTSYGVPSSIMKQVGATEGITAESWVVAPAVTFHPFPPLPSYPRVDKRMNHPVERQQSWHNNADAAWSNPTTSGMSPPDMPTSGPHNQNNFQRFRNSNRLGSRYFRQQKWNNSRPGRPWNANKNGSGGFIGPNNSQIGVRYGGNEANGSHNAGVVSSRNETYGNSLYQQPQH